MSDSAWERTILRESGFRRCLILYGNVRDLWTTPPGRHLRLSEYISESLSSMFPVRGTWDGVDGLKFPNTGQLTDFQDRLESASYELQEGEDYVLDDANLGSVESNNSGPANAPASYRSGSVAFPAMRQILNSPFSTPSLFIIDWAENLLYSPNRQDSEERIQLTNLAKAVSEQPPSQLRPNAFNSPTGLLVIITPTLGDLPPKLYSHDSRIRIVPVPTPDLEARRKAISTLSGDFILRKSSDQIEPFNLLAEMTDGMNGVDLRNMAALSRQSSTPLGIDSLVNLYRFGEQESPWTQLDQEKVGSAGEIISNRVKGLDGAVEMAVTMLIRAYLGLAGIQHSRLKTKPKGTLFLVGPTGVGKTELAKSIAEFIFGDEGNCIRFDMSEYSQEHADQRLIGAPPGYVGFEEGGQLTNAVAEKPFSVLLFDEIEKAHPRVLDKFLQILEDGRLTDGRGQTVHFSETVIIFTSNIGAGNANPKMSQDEVRAHFFEAVRTHFNETLGRPELLNRFGDNVIVFDFIDDPSIRSQIMIEKLKGVKDHLRENYNLTLEIDDDYVQRLVSMGKLAHGGRGLINVIEREIVNPMSIFIFGRLHLIGERSLTISVSEGDYGEASFCLGD